MGCSSASASDKPDLKIYEIADTHLIGGAVKRFARDYALKPAFPLVLTNEEHALLGELVEIMGMIEHMLTESMERFDTITAGKIRKQTAAPQAALWANAVKGRVKDPQIAAQIPVAQKEIEEVAEERNDFIHALYTNDYVDDYVEPGYQTTSVTRSKTGKTRPTDDLRTIRDRAAKLSCLIAQIANAI